MANLPTLPGVSITSNTLSGELKREPPKLLYHYTSTKGIKGILESKKVWATNVRYLNDSKEFYLVFEYALREAQKRIKTASGMEKSCYEFFLELMDSPHGWSSERSWIRGFDNSHQLFTCSFSERGDLLSQWRAYCPTGGYSIGFETSSITEVIEREKPKYELYPCVYKEDVQKEIIKEYFDSGIASVSGQLGNNNKDEMIKAYGSDLQFKLVEIAPIFKHHSFEEEREWRLVYDAKFGRVEKFKFRDDGALLKPYVEFPLLQKGRLKNCLIMVSPMKDQKIAGESLVAFAKEHMESSSVTLSDSPFKSA